ncbi:MAG: AAA family ATPase [Myxococcota bacterium]
MESRGKKRYIAILNQKGGTGKTTTAVSIAAGFAEAGRRTLLIDTDAQGAVGTSLGVRGEKTLADILLSSIPPDECEIPIRDNLFVITADEKLIDVEAKLLGANEGAVVLRNKLQTCRSGEIVVFDCPPTLNIIAQLVLNAADEVIIPVSCDYLSMVSIKQIFTAVEKVNAFRRNKLAISGILPTFFDARTRISHEVLTTLKRHFSNILLPPVRVNTRLKEAPSWRKTIFEYAPDSHGAEDYRSVVKAMLKRGY